MSDELKQQRPTTFENMRAALRADAHASVVDHHSSLITHHSSLDDTYKQVAREQWSANPCGARVANDVEFGSREYFDAIEKYRYEEAPWMKQAIGFDGYAGK